MLFSESVERNIWFLCFVFLMWYITFADLWIFNHPCITERNPHGSWCTTIVLLNSLSQYFVDNCYISVCWGYWPLFFLTRGALVLLSGWCWPCKVSLKCPHLFSVWGQVWEVVFFEHLVELTSEAVWSWIFVRRLLITDSSWYGCSVYSDFVFLEDLVLGRYRFPGIHPFPWCPLFFENNVL